MAQTSELKNAVLYNATYTAGTPGTRLDPYHVVKATTTAFTVDLCAGGTGAPDKPYGIVLDKTDYSLVDSEAITAGTYVKGSYTDGDTCVVVCGGQCLAYVGTSGVTAGNFVMADASGHVVDHTPGGYIIGIAMETATSTNLARIQVESMATADAATVERQVASANGAITISNGIVILTKSGVAAMTLADPSTANNYDRILFVSNTANAHTITADWNGAGSAAYTFPAEAGATMSCMAYGGKWLMPTTIKCTAFVGALTGNVTGNCSGSSGSCTGNSATATLATTATTANSIASASIFLSNEITGNAGSQDTAHGLGSVPSKVFVIPSDLSGGAFTVVYGAHDGTNTKTTVTNGEKYRVVAFK